MFEGRSAHTLRTATFYTVSAETDTLTSQVEEIITQVATIEEDMQQSRTFFENLRDLLIEIYPLEGIQ